MEKKLQDVMVNVVHPNFIRLEAHIPPVELLVQLIQTNVDNMTDLQFALFEYGLRKYKLCREATLLAKPKGDVLRQSAAICRTFGNNLLRVGAAINQGTAYEFHALREFWSGLQKRNNLFTNPIVQSTSYEMEYCLSEFIDLPEAISNAMPNFTHSNNIKAVSDNLDNAIKTLINIRIAELKEISETFPRKKSIRPFISEARIFLSKELKQFSFPNRVIPGRLLRQYEARPGETVKLVIEFTKRTEVTGESIQSALDTVSDEVTQSLQEEKKHLESVRTNDKESSDNYLEDNSSLESGWDVNASATAGYGPVSASVDGGAYADAKEESISKETINTETSVEKFAQDELNVLEQQTSKVNRARQVEAKDISKSTTEETNKTLSEKVFPNPNTLHSMSIEFSQGIEPFEVYILISDIELVFSTGLEKTVIPISNFDLIKKYVTDDFDLAIFKEAIKALSEMDYAGNIVNTIKEKDGRLFLNLKNEDPQTQARISWGIPIKRKDMYLNSDAILEKTYLVTDVKNADMLREKTGEETLRSLKLDNEKKEREVKLLDKNVEYEEIRVRFGREFADAKDVSPEAKNKFAVSYFNPADIPTKKVIMDFVRDSDLSDLLQKIDPEE